MGWASGLQSGMALGNTIRQGMLQQDLAEEAKKYKVTEGAYGSGLSENLQQVIGARDQALQGLGEGATPEQIQQVHEQYTPAMAELSRRVGLSGPDYSVNSGQQNFADRQGAEFAASQLRTSGLADVYRSHGLVDKAEELTARAQQQQLTGLQLNKAKREDEDAVRMQAFEKEYSTLENPSDMAAVKSLAAKHQLNRAQQFTVASQISGIDKAELEVMDTYVKKAVKGKDLDGLLTLHKDDKNFADGTHFVKAVGKNGQIILNLVSDADPTKVLRTESFQNADMATAYLRKQAEDPGNVAEWALGVRLKEQQIKASEASIRASDASAGLSGERLRTLKEERDNRNEAAKIKEEYDALSDAEKMGPKGQGLVRKYNMTNAKAGGQISLGAQARPGQTMTDLEKENLRTYRDWEKDDRNARLPQAEKDKKAVQMGVYNFVNPTANTVQSGLGSNPYVNTGAGGGQGGAAKQEGLQTQAPKLNSMNVRLLGRAGNMGYNVELPDGTTRVMEQDELEDLGYKFPNGSGLTRPWYSDLMPR